MRRFIVQVTIDSLVILATVAVLSRIVVAQPFPFGGDGVAPIVSVDYSNWALVQLAITGASLTILYAIMRPLLIVLTGRLLLWSLGTFQIVVVAIVLAVSAWVSPLNIKLADPTWVWILVAALIVGALRIAAGAVLG